jgi:hypothetical protein
MDKETIQQIAAEVVRHLPSYAWLFLLVQVVLTLAAAGAGAFLGEYFKTRANISKPEGNGHDTRSLQAYLGHRNIQHTVRYTELAPERFKNTAKKK